MPKRLSKADPVEGQTGHDYRFDHVGADSSAWGRDSADESAPTNDNKKKERRSKLAETMIMADKPENCTPEQIRACHGDEKDHPCVSTTEEK